MFPIKSASDYRNYRIIVLDNGIKVLLASDIKPSLLKTCKNASNNENSEDETRLAAAALCIAAGSFDEPSDVPGLAHFLEHMVFMGSEKYPEENGYDSYLKMHGGSNNAYTADESTLFYFDVQPEHFDGALDRFAQFFISPLLREDAVDREVKAVDSEFKGRIPDDDWRTDEILHMFASEEHPYSRFTHGNKKSLVTIPKEKGIDVMKRLRIFFDTQYCTKQMTLSLCSPIPLDDLESMAMKYFCEISPRNIVKLHHNIELNNPYKLNQFHKLFYVTPVEEIHLVKMTWVIPPQQRHYRKKPVYYIAWLLQHQCRGSVYAYLKEKGYICSMDAYCSTQCTTFSRFCCTTELTEKGLDNIAEVIQTIFQYISMLQRTGASKEIYSQLQQISDNCFKYHEPDEPCDVVEDLVDNMQYYEDKDCLNGSSVFQEYDPTLIEEIQRYLTTERVNIVILSKKFQSICHNVEQWFKAKYTVLDIPSKWISTDVCTAVNESLHLPDENRYISDNFNLHDVDASFSFDYPTVIQDSVQGKVWYKPDRKFLLPKADINLMLLTPVAQRSAYDLMCCDMLEYILDFELEELSFEAAVAALNIGQSGTGKCHKIELSGFSDKLLSLFKDVINLLSSFHFTENAFIVSKEEIERDYRNALIRSEELNGTLKQLIMRSVVANPIESLKELVDLTPELLKDYYKEYFSQMYVESLFQGNIGKEEVECFQTYMYNAFEFKVLPADKFPEIKTLSLPKGQTVCRHNGFNKKDPNSVIHNYYEIGPPSLRMYNVASILQHIMEEPLFDILRTKQQLGYTVYCSCEYSEGGILGYSVTVETDSDKYNADEIDLKIKDFLKMFSEKIKAEDGYDKYVNSYIKSLKHADLSVSDEATRNWSEIYYQDYIFDRRYRSIEMAKQIDKQELLDFMQKYILDQDNVRMLSVQVIGHPSDEDLDLNELMDEDSGDDSYLSCSDGEGEEDVEDLRHREIKLINVDCVQYTRTILNISEFREDNSFYPVARMLLE